ncbi:hypothetical protein CEXT_103901 [Caerostris extrusa]|uniref:Chromo domain-containing protein n=1 Tax=Caerostris extrusa TaxID=172846 RepID=A0AAV4QAW1_CAEEX|nr:hypothetical protein CEXT_103901 [Caerostris extrusa]
MTKLGGYNKVTNKNKWKYLQSFEDFYRKLGCTMVNNSRSTRGRHRSDRNIMTTRTRDRETASPKSRNAKELREKIVNEKKVEEKPKVIEKKPEEPAKTAEKLKSPEKKRIEKPQSKEEEKDSKPKKEEKEKPRLARSQSLTKDKKDAKPEKARTREDARKEKNESPEKKGTRSTSKIDPPKKEKEDTPKKEKSPKEKDKKEEKDTKEEKVKVKKEDKVIKERKVLREKKADEKSPKEKRENPPREKRERDSSREDKGLPKIKKEDIKIPEDKSPKRKIERVGREKTEEKSPRLKLEDRALILEANKKPTDEIEIKVTKEEKPVKSEPEVKKEEKLRPKLRERKEDTPSLTGDENTAEDNTEDANTEPDVTSLDGSEKKLRTKTEEGEESPNKGKRKFMKSEDKDDKESLHDMSDSDDGSITNDSERNLGKEIDVGDRVKVKYGRGRMQKVYEAKVLKIDMDGPEKRYYVHYAGWNTRYDEWIKKNNIVATLSNSKQRSENSIKNLLSSTNLKKIDRGRPPGPPSAKLDRKNSTSSTSSRATRSEKKGSLPLSSGLEPKKRTRRKSGTVTSATDMSQESDTDGAELMDLDDDDADNSIAPPGSCFKEELFSDDEEKEKLEDVKRGDITELEKAISIEEGGDDIKDLCFSPFKESNNDTSKEVSVKLENLPKEESFLPKTEKEICIDKSHGKLSCENKDKSPVKVEELTINKMDIKFPSVLLHGIKKEKTGKDIDPVPITNETGANCSKIPSQISISSENKAALSFAGLIQKSTNESINLTPQKTIADNKMKPAVNVCCLPSNSSEKLVLEKKPDSLFRSVSIFGSVVKSLQSSESSNTFEKKFDSKPTRSPFSSLLKSENAPNNEGQLNQKIKAQDCNRNLKTGDFQVPCPDAPKLTPQESSKCSDIKESEMSPLKCLNPEKKGIEINLKDKFDILLESTNSFNPNPQKLPEIKDSIFSFSFSSHNVSKENSILNQIPSSSTNSLSRIQTKLETVDVSKMIPGILERLEKDVVADSKAPTPPLPPPKEELTFDFLRSQSISKSLSRSDSSNSLRICESDTNDSNIESKDIVTGGKLEMPVIAPSDTYNNPLEEKPKNIDIPKSMGFETNVSVSENVIIPIISKEEVKIPVTSQPASVITVGAPVPLLEFPSPPEKSKEPEALKIPILPQENTVLSKEDEKAPSPVPAILSKSDLPDILNATKENAENTLSPSKIMIKQEIPQNIPVENVNDKFEKEELESISVQNSVIKCAPIMAETENSENSKLPPAMKEPASNVKEEILEEKATSIPNTSGLDAIVNAAEIKDAVAAACNAPETDSCLDSSKVIEEGSLSSQLGKKDNKNNDIKRKKMGKKIGKKLGSTEASEKEDKDVKGKDGKNKSKKRLRMEVSDGKNLDLKPKSKKLKKNKNKKRFSRHDDQFGDSLKKFEFRDDDHKEPVSDKIKKKEKKRNEKKFLKCGTKYEEFLDGKHELCKKKKNKKNRDKFVNDKKDFFEKKTKKKRKCHFEDNQDSDSEKEIPTKLVDKKRKKKKFKVKDCSSSDDATEKFSKENRDAASTSNSLMRQDSKSDDPDMSFLLCEEKVPASPADMGDGTSGSSSNEEDGRLGSGMDLLPSVYPRGSRDSSNTVHKHNIVLHDTPPTTPSSTESLLSSSPSHERDTFPINYPESTQSGEGEPDLFHCNSNRTVVRGSEEYRAAATLAFAVCKSAVSEKPKEVVPQAKSSRGDHSPSKRKKKRVQRYSETTKSPKHKSSYSRGTKRYHFFISDNKHIIR